MTWTGPTPAGIAVLTAAATLVAACTGPAIDRSAPTPGSVAVSRSVVAHNSADEVFTLEMIRCHQQAIQMSEILLAKQDVDTRVVQLARQIQSMQTVELQHMLSWLRQWEIPVSTPRDGCSQPGVNNVDALQIAEGRTAGTVYLNQMIEHHRRSITLAHREIGDGEFRAAVALATSIATIQQIEIDTMASMLRTA